MGKALHKLLVKVKPHVRKHNGKLVHVEGYTYVRDVLPKMMPAKPKFKTGDRVEGVSIKGGTGHFGTVVALKTTGGAPTYQVKWDKGGTSVASALGLRLKADVKAKPKPKAKAPPGWKTCEVCASEGEDRTFDNWFERKGHFGKHHPGIDPKTGEASVPVAQKAVKKAAKKAVPKKAAPAPAPTAADKEMEPIGVPPPVGSVFQELKEAVEGPKKVSNPLAPGYVLYADLPDDQKLDASVMSAEEVEPWLSAMHFGTALIPPGGSLVGRYWTNPHPKDVDEIAVWEEWDKGAPTGHVAAYGAMAEHVAGEVWRVVPANSPDYDPEEVGVPPLPEDFEPVDIATWLAPVKGPSGDSHEFQLLPGAKVFRGHEVVEEDEVVDVWMVADPPEDGKIRSGVLVYEGTEPTPVNEEATPELFDQLMNPAESGWTLVAYRSESSIDTVDMTFTPPKDSAQLVKQLKGAPIGLALKDQNGLIWTKLPDGNWKSDDAAPPDEAGSTEFDPDSFATWIQSYAQGPMKILSIGHGKPDFVPGPSLPTLGEMPGLPVGLYFEWQSPGDLKVRYVKVGTDEWKLVGADPALASISDFAMFVKLGQIFDDVPAPEVKTGLMSPLEAPDGTFQVTDPALKQVPQPKVPKQPVPKAPKVSKPLPLPALPKKGKYAKETSPPNADQMTYGVIAKQGRSLIRANLGYRWEEPLKGAGTQKVLAALANKDFRAELQTVAEYMRSGEKGFDTKGKVKWSRVRQQYELILRAGALAERILAGDMSTYENEMAYLNERFASKQYGVKVKGVGFPQTTYPTHVDSLRIALQKGGGFIVFAEKDKAFKAKYGVTVAQATYDDLTDYATQQGFQWAAGLSNDGLLHWVQGSMSHPDFMGAPLLKLEQDAKSNVGQALVIKASQDALAGAKAPQAPKVAPEPGVEVPVPTGTPVTPPDSAGLLADEFTEFGKLPGGYMSKDYVHWAHELGGKYLPRMNEARRRRWGQFYLAGNKVALFQLEYEAAIRPKGQGKHTGQLDHPGSPDSPQGKVAWQMLANLAATRPWGEPFTKGWDTEVWTDEALVAFIHDFNVTAGTVYEESDLPYAPDLEGTEEGKAWMAVKAKLVREVVKFMPPKLLPSSDKSLPAPLEKVGTKPADVDLPAPKKGVLRPASVPEDTWALALALENIPLDDPSLDVLSPSTKGLPEKDLDAALAGSVLMTGPWQDLPPATKRAAVWADNNAVEDAARPAYLMKAIRTLLDGGRYDPPPPPGSYGVVKVGKTTYIVQSGDSVKQTPGADTLVVIHADGTGTVVSKDGVVSAPKSVLATATTFEFYKPKKPIGLPPQKVSLQKAKSFYGKDFDPEAWTQTEAWEKLAPDAGPPLPGVLEEWDGPAIDDKLHALNAPAEFVQNAPLQAKRLYLSEALQGVSGSTKWTNPTSGQEFDLMPGDKVVAFPSYDAYAIVHEGGGGLWLFDVDDPAYLAGMKAQAEQHAASGTGVIATYTEAAKDEIRRIFDFKARYGHYGLRSTPPVLNPEAAYAIHIAKGQTSEVDIGNWGWSAQHQFAADFGVDQPVPVNIAAKLRDLMAVELPRPIPGAKLSLTKVSPVIHGGSHSKDEYLDQFGRRWLAKYYVHDPNGPYRVEAEHYANEIGRLMGFRQPETRATDAGGRFAYVQYVIPKTPKGSLTGKTLVDLSDAELAEVSQEQLLDWMLSNHDSHPDNLIFAPDGHIVGVDKGQAFKFFPDDKLSATYTPKGNHGIPVYNTLLQAIAKKQLSKERADTMTLALLKRARRLENRSDDQYRSLLELALAKRTDFPAEVPTREAFIDALMERKHALAKDFEALYKKAYKSAGYSWDHPALDEIGAGVLEGPTGPVYLGPSLALAEAVKETQVHGTASMFAGPDLEDGHILWWEERSPQGDAVLVGQAMVRKEAGADTRITNWIAAQSPTVAAPSVKPQQAIGGLPNNDEWYNAVVNAAKTVNTHAADGEYNPGKIDTFETARAQMKEALAAVEGHEEVNAGTPYKGSPSVNFEDLEQQAAWKDMVKTYLDIADQVQKAKDAGTKTPSKSYAQVVYTPKPKPKAINEWNSTVTAGHVLRELDDGSWVIVDKDGVVVETLSPAKAKKALSAKPYLKVYQALDVDEHGTVATLRQREDGGWELNLLNDETLVAAGTLELDPEAAAGLLGLDDSIVIWLEESKEIDLHNLETWQDVPVLGDWEPVTTVKPTVEMAAMKVSQAANSRPEGNLDLKSGVLVQTGNLVANGHPGKRLTVDVGNISIEYRPWNGYGVSASQQGMLRIWVRDWKGSDNDMQQSIEVLREMGLDLTPADEDGLELTYWRVLGGVSGDRKGVPVSVKSAVARIRKAREDNPGMSQEEELALHRHEWAGILGKDKVDNAPWQPRFDHTRPQSPELVAGRPYWLRPDVSEEAAYERAIEKGVWPRQSITYGGQASDTPKVVQSGGLAPTEERTRLYGQWLPKGSSAGDQGKGSASYVFIYPNNSHVGTHNFIIVSPRVHARMHTYASSSDKWGVVDSRKDYAPWDPLHAMEYGGGGQLMVKNIVSLLDSIEFVVLANPGPVIEFLKQHGITSIRGVPVEQRIVGTAPSTSDIKKVMQASLEWLREQK